MIEDPHERTRAILWMLADLDPQMPLLEALGQLKAVEATLEAQATTEADSGPRVARGTITAKRAKA